MLYNNKCIILEHMLVFHAVKNHLGDILFHVHSDCTGFFSSQTLKSEYIV